MSAVTKVLVILLVVLSIAFSMTAVAFTARTENWKQLAESYRTATQVAYAEQRSQMAARAAELASARDTVRSHQGRINDLERQLQSTRSEVADQQVEIAQLTADKRRSDALAQRLTNELGIAQTARAAVEQQRQQFESRNIELERRNIDLNDRVNELTTQVTVLTQQGRRQEQRIHILQEENQKLAQQAGALSAGGTAFRDTVSDNIRPNDQPGGAPHISGHVTFVDGDLLTLSVGSADRVRRGQVFVVFRGPQYIGDVRITDVEPNLSSGRLFRAAPGLSPRNGDRAEDDVHFATPP